MNEVNEEGFSPFVGRKLCIGYRAYMYSVTLTGFTQWAKYIQNTSLTMEASKSWITLHAYRDTSGSRSTFSLSNLINILAVHSANSFFPFCISAVLGSEYCSGYMDALGKWNTGFYCPNSDESNDVFCCGTEIHKYCCTKKDKVIQSEVQE